jgi:hypothetical protein
MPGTPWKSTLNRKMQARLKRRSYSKRESDSSPFCVELWFSAGQVQGLINKSGSYQRC